MKHRASGVIKAGPMRERSDLQSTVEHSFAGGVDAATLRRFSEGGRSALASDAQLLAEFEEFMAVAARRPEPAGAPPEASFRERLRRNLWRTHGRNWLRRASLLN
jgi:hypothetical protein